ncbi:unnamed protein product [Meganyctiphanes norvegica]|uniref:Uncharacterized protein n=1 Tax=Meganyctiphanes norvegica TaxID=48144 RepID=A0AAV2RRG4_MEGNR
MKLSSVLLIVCGIALVHLTTGNNEVSKQREKILFFGSSLTTTFMSVSTITSIVPFTCFTTDAALMACDGKKRRKRTLINLDEMVDTDLQLDASQQKEAFDKQIDIADDNIGKLLFTVWRTSFTTKTFTSFSTNRDVTISIQPACFIAGVEPGTNPFCG